MAATEKIKPAKLSQGDGFTPIRHFATETLIQHHAPGWYHGYWAILNGWSDHNTGALDTGVAGIQKALQLRGYGWHSDDAIRRANKNFLKWEMLAYDHEVNEHSRRFLLVLRRSVEQTMQILMTAVQTLHGRMVQGKLVLTACWKAAKDRLKRKVRRFGAGSVQSENSTKCVGSPRSGIKTDSSSIKEEPPSKAEVLSAREKAMATMPPEILARLARLKKT